MIKIGLVKHVVEKHDKKTDGQTDKQTKKKKKKKYIL